MEQNKKDVFDYINPFTSGYVKPCVDWVSQSKIHLAIVIIGIILTIIYASLLKQALVLSFLIFLGGISKIYQRYLRTHTGVEFLMLSAVVAGFVYGPFLGGVVGFATFLLAIYISGRFSHNRLPSFILMALVGVAASFFSNIVVAGIVITIVYDLIFGYMFVTWYRARLYKTVIFIVTHIVWNIYVFTKIAPLFVNALM